MKIHSVEWYLMADEFSKRNLYELLTITFDQLNENSIVYDFGGYIGNWTSDIYSRYLCNIFTYEPITEFYNIMTQRFKNNKKINIFNYGVYNKTCELELFMDKDGTTIFKNSKLIEHRLCNMVDVCEVFNHETVDIVCINIEGSEYDVINRMIESEHINKINSILIQYHNNVENSLHKMTCINQNLEKLGYKCVYDYPYIWTYWTKL